MFLQKVGGESIAWRSDGGQMAFMDMAVTGRLHDGARPVAGVDCGRHADVGQRESGQLRLAQVAGGVRVVRLGTRRVAPRHGVAPASDLREAM